MMVMGIGNLYHYNSQCKDDQINVINVSGDINNH